MTCRATHRCTCSGRTTCCTPRPPTYSKVSVNGNCVRCDPPVNSLANNPTWVSGRTSYTWTCRGGTYGNSVTRTCSTTTGWGGSAIVCTRCVIPTVSTAVNPTQVDGTATYTWNCATGE